MRYNLPHHFLTDVLRVRRKGLVQLDVLLDERLVKIDETFPIVVLPFPLKTIKQTNRRWFHFECWQSTWTAPSNKRDAACATFLRSASVAVEGGFAKTLLFVGFVTGCGRHQSARSALQRSN
jgi:hypothetical protein